MWEKYPLKTSFITFIYSIFEVTKKKKQTETDFITSLYYNNKKKIYIIIISGDELVQIVRRSLRVKRKIKEIKK